MGRVGEGGGRRAKGAGSSNRSVTIFFFFFFKESARFQGFSCDNRELIERFQKRFQKGHGGGGE